MRKMLAVLTFLIMVAGLAVAQGRAPEPMRDHGIRRNLMFKHMGGPGMPGMGAWWKNSEIAKELNLTDAQQKQLESTFLDQRAKLIDLNADLDHQELKLEPLISADTVDENAISRQLDLVVAARGRLEKSNAMMHVAMRKVLNQEQWKKLQGMHKMRMRNSGRGDGMFMHHGPMPPAAPGTPAPAPAPPPPGGPSED